MKGGIASGRRKRKRESKMEKNTITVDGIEYVRKPVVTGKRAVIVADRGWMFAGDIERRDGRIYFTRALHFFGFKQMGFSRAIREWKSDSVDVRPTDDFDMPADVELFCVPVADNWGIK
jgi:hypothetical protein